MFTLAFNERQRLNEALDLSQYGDFRIRLNHAAGVAPYQMVAESFGSPGSA